ncbi:MAG: penicillin-binding transpeptidase domain-containing protein, partial [Myxococcaceae bacterium]
GRYMGCMNVRQALTQSRNTTTVQVGMKVGVDPVLETAKLAGITSPIDPNPSSFLGSSGVSPLELVTAYSTFARGGIYMPSKSILRVMNNKGEALEVAQSIPKRVFKQDYVAALVDILIDVVNKGTGTNARLPKRVVAGKTGTTDQVRDIWFVGFTSDMVTGVWFGNTKNVPLHGVFSSDAAVAWHRYTEEFYKNHPRPETAFFHASNEYAAKAQLLHLIDPIGVAEARRHMGSPLLSSEVSFGAKTPASKVRTGIRIDITEDEPVGRLSVKVDGQAVEPSGKGSEGRNESQAGESQRPIPPIPPTP